MAAVKEAKVVWSGEGMDFTAHTAPGYTFRMRAPSDEQGATPMEYLLAGVAGCTAMDVVAILQKRRMALHGVAVEIVGKQAETPPNVYTHVTITYVVRGENIDPAAVERAIDLSKSKYCSASAMFERSGTEVVSAYRIEEAATA
jgi:putative redox protein